MNKKYYYFYNGPLSNFYIIDKYKGKHSEGWFMQYKALFFEDHESYNQIIGKSPKIAKRIGRKIKNFNQEEWDVVKFDFMYMSIYRKYKICKPFKDIVDQIYKENLYPVEASPYDRIWGIGYNKNDAEDNIQNWGLNLLGKCIAKLAFEMNHDFEVF